MLTLYSNPSSYYSMIARLALIESGVVFLIKPMDIHFAKDQLRDWYILLNPNMTVPTLAGDNRIWTNSHEILTFAVHSAADQWADSNLQLTEQINTLVEAHYALSIEQLTFGKALVTFFPLRFMVPRMLRAIIHQLEQALPSSTNRQAIEAKIAVNQQRLAYFLSSDLSAKLLARRHDVMEFIKRLPTPDEFILGKQISSVDIVLTILFSRLRMIGEYQLLNDYPALDDWYKRMTKRPAFTKADIWYRFHPMRMLLRY